MTTCCASVLLPAFSFQSRDSNHIRDTCRGQFGVDQNRDFDLFALVPLTQDWLEQQANQDNCFEIGVRMNSPSFSNLTLRNF